MFVDHKPCEGFEGVKEDDVEIILDKVIMLLHFLQEKDRFEKHYKQHLAKRLSSGKKVFENAKRSLTVKLKTELEGCLQTLRSPRMQFGRFMQPTV